MLYDDYELKWVGEYRDVNDETYCEPITDDNLFETPIRTLWTVYGHKPEGGVEAIADFDTEADARELYGFLQTTLSAYTDRAVQFGVEMYLKVETRGSCYTEYLPRFIVWATELEEAQEKAFFIVDDKQYHGIGGKICHLGSGKSFEINSLKEVE